MVGIQKTKNIGGGSIKSKMLKLASVVIVIGTLLPTNIFGYGDTENQYVNNVDSTIKINEIQSNNKEISNSSKIVPTGIANVLGINTSENKEYNVILEEDIMGNGIMFKSNDSKQSLENKYGKSISIQDQNIYSTNIISIESTKQYAKVEDSNTKYSTMLTKKQENIYNGPGKNYKKIKELPVGSEVKLSGIESNGYELLVNDGNDQWIKKSSLWTVKEAEEAEQKALQEAIEKDRKNRAEKVKVNQGKALLSIDNADPNYKGGIVKLTPEDRDLCERLVMGEAGGQGFIGTALVAQALRDSILYRGYGSVAEVRRSCGYTGRIDRKPNDDVLDAVAFIFDDGGYAVKHTVYFFYAPGICTSSWHESQQFIVEYKGHRFFSTW